MKKLFALAILAVSFNVHAIPPPPPPPDAIGSLTATLKMRVLATDYTQCDGYFCKNKIVECEIQAKIPVLPANPYGGGHYMQVSKSADGKHSAVCRNVFSGFEHFVNMTVYVTKNDASALTLFSESRSGKSKQGESLSTSNSASTVLALPSDKSSFSVSSSIGADISNYNGNNPLAITSSDINLSISFPSLVVEAP
jgi:hypothetical protein